MGELVLREDFFVIFFDVKSFAHTHTKSKAAAEWCLRISIYLVIQSPFQNFPREREREERERERERE